MPETVTDLQLQRLRAMTAEEKLKRLEALFLDARALVEAGVRFRQPELEGAALAAAVQKIFAGAGG